MPADAALVARAEARVGTTLKGKYTIDKLIGVGGMAVVYSGRHRNSKRVAIKVMHAELSIESGVRTRFLREGYLANTVEHPGAVRVDDDDIAEDGCAFLVMELLDGETVDARFEHKGRRLPVVEVLSVADQTLSVLIAAHDKGIVHRDIKPENLFLNRDGLLKVLDFGIARLREVSDGGTSTRTGSLMGTPAFMAPEHARGHWEDVDARTDLWAVGATMFTLLTGRLVHQARTANEMLAMAITQTAPPLATVIPDVHPAVAQLVDHSLAYERDARFQDARAFQLAIRETYAAIKDNPDARLPSLTLSDHSSPFASRAPLPSAPDRPSAPSSEPAAVVAPLASLTTGRAVTAAPESSDQPRPKPAGRRPLSPRTSVALALGGVAAVLFVVALIALTRGASTHPTPLVVSSDAVPAPVAARASVVQPTVDPATSGQSVGLEALPVEKKRVKTSGGAPVAAKTALPSPPAATTQTPTPKSKGDVYSKRR